MRAILLDNLIAFWVLFDRKRVQAKGIIARAGSPQFLTNPEVL
jgi:hypothetical protein